MTNLGALASSGTITVKGTLPSGVTTAGTPTATPRASGWVCSPEGPGQSEFTCTNEEVVAPQSAASPLQVPVLVGPGAVVGSTLTARFEISGGGARPVVSEAATVIGAPADPFGVLEGSFTAGAFNAAGGLETGAGVHPEALSTTFLFPSATSVNEVQGIHPNPVEDVRQIVTDLPAGLIGDALAAPTCPESTLDSLIQGSEILPCPPASRVGTLTFFDSTGVAKVLQVYNVTPERGYPAELGVFEPTVKRAAFLFASVVGSGADTHVRITSSPQTRFSQLTGLGVSLTLFGDPGVRDHSGIAPAAFYTNPSDCSASGFTTTLHVDSWQHPGRTLLDGEPDFSDENWKSAETTSPPVTGCEQLQFHPTLSVQPTNNAPDSPTGMNVTMDVPQNEDPDGLSTPPLKNATVTLPRGLVVSPSAANGLEACSNEQFAPATNDPATCPQASQIGTVTLHTPLLKEAVEGEVFLGAPECSPCTNADAQAGRLARLFIQFHSEQYGITLKVPGSVSINPATGQLTATFDNNPQQPFSSLELHFPQSDHATLSTPDSCGTYTTTSDLTPWSSPWTPDATPSSSFGIGCASNAFSPSFSAGTTSPQAGAYSPFELTFSRNDGEQDFSDVEQTLPPGMLAKLAGVPRCGEAEAAAGTCSAASRIGGVTVAAGPGGHPFYTTGSIYLTGPYNGGPFGEVVVVQAVAGPFNLGTVAVRGSIRVNPVTAQATVVSDPFPTMLAGIPLQIRTVNVDLERPGFTFNATNCGAMAVTGKLVSTQNTGASLSSPYQATNCASLKFAPVLSASTAGKASKANGATLDVKVAYPSGPFGSYANIKSVKVDLPVQLPSRLSTLQKACLAATFAANPASCPSASDVGTVTAGTPLLGVPLTGPAYLVSHGGEAFPDLEFVLQGEGVTVVLDAKTDIKKGITSSALQSIPDAPVSSFELKLPTGKYSILGANVPEKDRYVLCGQTLNMPTMITAQNGAVIKQTTKIGVANCVKAKKAATKKAKRSARNGGAK